MKDKNNKNDRFELSFPLNRKVLKYAILFVAIIAAVYFVIAFPDKISGAIKLIIDVITPILLGFCLAYVVNLLLRPIENLWCRIWRNSKKQERIAKLKRPVCVAVSFLLVLGIFFAIIFMIIPALKATILSFAEKLPQYTETIESWFHGISNFFSQYGIDMPDISFNADKVTSVVKNMINSYGNNMLDQTVNFTASIFSVAVDVVLAVVFAVYMLAQKEKLCAQTKKTIYAVLRPKRAERLINLSNLANGVFTKFATGQLVEACIICLLCLLGMVIFGMPYAGIISVLIGFTALIPVFGAFIGTAVGAFLILLESPMMAFWFVVFIIVLQQVESNLIYPKVVGKSVGLPGIWVLAAVTIGGGLFGVLGMLFSVPVCSVLYVLFRNFVNKRTKELNIKQAEEALSETAEE